MTYAQMMQAKIARNMGALYAPPCYEVEEVEEVDYSAIALPPCDPETGMRDYDRINVVAVAVEAY